MIGLISCASGTQGGRRSTRCRSRPGRCAAGPCPTSFRSGEWRASSTTEARFTTTRSPRSWRRSARGRACRQTVCRRQLAPPARRVRPLPQNALRRRPSARRCSGDTAQERKCERRLRAFAQLVRARCARNGVRPVVSEKPTARCALAGRLSSCERALSVCRRKGLTVHDGSRRGAYRTRGEPDYRLWSRMWPSRSSRYFALHSRRDASPETGRRWILGRRAPAHEAAPRRGAHAAGRPPLDFAGAAGRHAIC